MCDGGCIADVPRKWRVGCSLFFVILVKTWSFAPKDLSAPLALMFIGDFFKGGGAEQARARRAARVFPALTV